ncbi:MAG TPA: hypothetical protein VIL72_05070 [Beijerinckiaceae bacterium]|jgi:hypothetical protein
MNRIVRKHFPAERLPQELREGLEAGGYVTVIVEREQPARRAPSLDELFARARPTFKDAADAEAHLRRVRDAWE